MAQAPGTQDVEEQIAEVKQRMLSLHGEIRAYKISGHGNETQDLIDEFRRRATEMTALADQQRQETLDWIQEKLDALDS